MWKFSSRDPVFPLLGEVAWQARYFRPTRAQYWFDSSRQTTREILTARGNLVRDMNTYWQYWNRILKICWELTCSGNYVCLPCWENYSRGRQNEDSTLKCDWLLVIAEIRRIIIFFGHRRDIIIFQFLGDVPRTSVCLFLPGSQT